MKVVQNLGKKKLSQRNGAKLHSKRDSRFNSNKFRVYLPLQIG